MATHCDPSCVFSHFPAVFRVLVRLFRELQQPSANFSSFLQIYRCVNLVLLPMYWSATLHRGCTRKVSSPPNLSAIQAVFRTLPRLLWSFPLFRKLQRSSAPSLSHTALSRPSAHQRRLRAFRGVSGMCRTGGGGLHVKYLLNIMV